MTPLVFCLDVYRHNYPGFHQDDPSAAGGLGVQDDSTSTAAESLPPQHMPLGPASQPTAGSITKQHQQQQHQHHQQQQQKELELHVPSQQGQQACSTLQQCWQQRRGGLDLEEPRLAGSSTQRQSSRCGSSAFTHPVRTSPAHHLFGCLVLCGQPHTFSYQHPWFILGSQSCKCMQQST